MQARLFEASGAYATSLVRNRYHDGAFQLSGSLVLAQWYAHGEGNAELHAQCLQSSIFTRSSRALQEAKEHAQKLLQIQECRLGPQEPHIYDTLYL